jgi:two-component system, NarL family, sensor histidine kinase EvgS
VTLRYAVAAVAAVSAEDANQRALTLAVSDTGVGIPKDRQAALFTPFIQAHDGGARRFGGTGLGLTICKRLVTMMGGTIELWSEAGRGTRFTVHVTFPKAEPSSVTEAVPIQTSGQALQGRSVLIVDDHPANRIVLDGQLRLLGASTRLAADGRAALAAWRAEPDSFDVILTDCSMPEMSGEELTQAIRAEEAKHAEASKHGDVSKHATTNVPVIGLTANAQPEAAARALASGMTMCLVKPIGLDELRDALLVALPSATTHRTPVPFDQTLLDAFGANQAKLIDTLRNANEQDLADARTAMQTRDYGKLRDVAHRMKGAAALIGATPFVNACAVLQHDCEHALTHANAEREIEKSFKAFVDAAAALDAALHAPAAR